MVVSFPNFCKLDCNDGWVESCGSTKYSQNHNIRKNAAMLSWSCHDMNWLNFLDVLDCYRRQQVATCRFCKKYSNCHHFKLLCAEAWGITLNSWRNERSYVVAVRFNVMNRNYRLLPMTDNISVKMKKNFIKKRNKKFFMKKLFISIKDGNFFKF